MNLQKYYQEEYLPGISKLRLLKNNNSNKVLFLDRDGILIKDVHHIDECDKVELCDNVISFLTKARQLKYNIVIVTNQSSVSRSIISYKDYIKITCKFLTYLEESLFPDLILASFHLPDNKNKLPNFEWRKPGKGMFNYTFNLKKYLPSKSIMIGDKLTDLIPAYESNIPSLFYIPSNIHIDETRKISYWNRSHELKIKTSNLLDNSMLENNHQN